jgi:arginine repressor
MEKPVRPKDVVAALAAKGIEVSFPHVAKVLKSMGMKRKRRRKVASSSATPAIAANSASLNINDVVAAKKLVGHVGSIEKVKEALAALARLC